MNINVEFYAELKEILAKYVVKSEKVNIDEMYNGWMESKDNRKEFKNFVCSESVISESQGIPKDTTLKGIDLPTWFGNVKGTKIMILGIDPLRNKFVFNREGAKLESDVVIGTPYAFHEFDTRNSNTKPYWTLVDGLAKDNFVYCTDIFKTYFIDASGKRSYVNKEYTEREEHRELLDQEIEKLGIDKIIVFGGKAHGFLFQKGVKIGQSINNTKKVKEVSGKEIPVYTVMHLSGSTRNPNMKTFLEANGVKNVNPGNRTDCAYAYLEILEN